MTTIFEDLRDTLEKELADMTARGRVLDEPKSLLDIERREKIHAFLALPNEDTFLEYMLSLRRYDTDTHQRLEGLMKLISDLKKEDPQTINMLLEAERRLDEGYI